MPLSSEEDLSLQPAPTALTVAQTLSSIVDSINSYFSVMNPEKAVPNDDEDEVLSTIKRARDLLHAHMQFKEGGDRRMAEYLGLPQVIINSSGKERVSRFHARCPAGRHLVVYGDEGYGQSPEVQAPFRGNILSPEQETRMDSITQSYSGNALPGPEAYFTSRAL
ncbi:hypothetical protein BKA57DRAFT_488960 [Linnemannia elongata]|nr:hypothetical protein BKA57DRAFT_488960 [Linnemannia elongata]